MIPEITDPFAESPLDRIIARLREATRGSAYENRLHLVGGLLRDRALGLPLAHDLDLVVEGDAVELAHFLYRKGLSEHFPVTYPRFGTALLSVRASGCDSEADAIAVELVSARAESYAADSRKPEVRQGTLREDVFRRDFTINTLLENLRSGEILDLTGRARQDLQAGVVRTPLEPRATFFDDPLRMLRAVRFASRFDFEIEAGTWDAICAESERLRPPAISSERIRDEFTKILKLPGVKIRRGLQLLLDSGLLEKFLPEMLPMVGCSQGTWHPHDVWGHTLTALTFLPDNDAPLEVRLGLLWHDVGKPATRAEDAGKITFYGHAAVGAEITRQMMNHLKFSNEEIKDVTTLVAKHMRLGDYRANWTDASVKRLIRDCEPYLDRLFALVRCDMASLNIPAGEGVDLAALRQRIDALNAVSNIARIESPLDGNAIMETLGIGPGPALKEAKEFLVNAVLDGLIAEGDQEKARESLRDWFNSKIQVSEG